MYKRRSMGIWGCILMLCDRNVNRNTSIGTVKITGVKTHSVKSLHTLHDFCAKRDSFCTYRKWNKYDFYYSGGDVA